VAFPLTKLDVRAAVALGADLTASPTAWLWTDATDKVYTRDPITIGRGRPDQAGVADTAQLSMTGDNRDGRWSTRNPSGAWYGRLRKGTPARVSVRRILDTFARTEAAGWGTADSGQAWTVSGGSASDFAVSGGSGSLSLGSLDVARSARAACALAYGEIYGELTMPVVATGGAISCSLVGRSTDSDNEYRFRLSFAEAGALAVRILVVVAGATGFVTGSVALADTYEAGDTVAVRARMNGPALAMKAWNTTGAEPAGYHAEGTDTTWARGAAGVAAATAAETTNTLPVVVGVDNFAMEVPRYAGFFSDLPPRWDVSGLDRHAPLAAKGLIYRLGRGASPARSALRRTILSDDSPAPAAYWALEDGENATSGAFSLPTLGPSLVRAGPGEVFFAGVGGTAGTSPLPDFSASGRLRAKMPVMAGGGTSVQASMVGAFSPSSSSSVDVASLVEFRTPGLTWSIISYRVADVGWVELICNPDSGGFTSAAVEVELFDGVDRTFSAWLTQDGANIDFALSIDGVEVVDSTIAGTLAAPTDHVEINSTRFDSDGVTDGVLTAGQLVFYLDQSDPVDLYPAMTGYDGEQAHTRFLRLCAEENVPATCGATQSQAMGPQLATKTLLELLRELEATDQAFLYEDTFHGLVLQSHTERENLPVTLALTYTTPGHVAPPLEPTDDDQDAINDVEVAREGGSSSQLAEEDPAVELSVPNIGRRAESQTYSLHTDAQAYHLAGWRLHMGTSPGYRFPTVALNLAAGLDLIDTVLSADLAHRLTIADPPDDIGPDLVDLVTEGYAETLEQFGWDVTANCSLFGPHRVFVLAEDSDDTGEFLGRLVPDTCYSVDAHDSDDTAWLVFTDPYWTRTADDLPCDVLTIPDGSGSGGEVMALTALESSGEDAFFRVEAAGWGTADSGQAWTVVPGGGGADADFEVTTTPNGHARITPSALATDYKAVLDVGGHDRDASMELAVVTLPASGTLRIGVVARYADTSNFVHAELRIATTGLMDLRVVQRVAGSATTLLTMPMGGYVLAVNTKWTVRVKVVGSTVKARAWLTSGAEPSWWCQTTTAVDEGTSVGAFCRNDTAATTHIFRYDGLDVREPANWTVTRSVNEVTKSHAASSAIEVADPMVLAL
jgi:hypothetical protein